MTASKQALKDALAAARNAVTADTLQAQVRAILKDHGEGARNLGELKPKLYATVTQCLKAISDSTVTIASADDDDEAPDDPDAAAKSAPGKVTWYTLRDNWIWCTEIQRFIRRHDCVMWNVAQFDSEFGFISTAANRRRPFSNQKTRLVRFERMIFHPGRPEFDGKSYNTWRPSPIAPQYGDTRLWDTHLMTLIKDPLSREQLLDWCAWVYQNQDKKPTHALLLVGETAGTDEKLHRRE